MDVILTRKTFALYGIEGELRDSLGNFICYTLEHAYPIGAGFAPKVAVGAYKCLRHAPNRLSYETFELQDVPPFCGVAVEGILIHVGNYNNDSEGCILLGEKTATGCILESRAAFDAFMELQKNVDSFTIHIS